MSKKLFTKEKIEEKKEDIIDELAELDVDQHPRFYKNKPEGRKRTANLLLKLNDMEKRLMKVRR